MTDTTVAPSADNLVVPFHLASGAFRGRLVRVGRLVADALAPHDYPAPVATLVAETLALAVALASTLKYDGLFTLQIQGDGPVRLVVADITSGGMARAIARFDADRLAAALASPDPDPTAAADAGPTAKAGPTAVPLNRLVGAGHLAFTVDQGRHTDRYQGIVALDGTTVAQSARAYFARSEQVPTVLTLAVRPPVAPESGSVAAPSTWAAAALVLQRMPADSGGRSGPDWDDAWTTAHVLMDSLTADELTNPDLTPDQLLRRPFHGDDLVVAPAWPVFFGCRCSRHKVLRSLASFPLDEVRALEKNGTIDVTCEFCKATYALTMADIEAVDPTADDETPSDSE